MIFCGFHSIDSHTISNPMGPLSLKTDYRDSKSEIRTTYFTDRLRQYKCFQTEPYNGVFHTHTFIYINHNLL